MKWRKTRQTFHICFDKYTLPTGQNNYIKYCTLPQAGFALRRVTFPFAEELIAFQKTAILSYFNVT